MSSKALDEASGKTTNRHRPKRAPSLARRLYIASGTALVLVFGLLWIAQQQAFMQLVRGRLQGHIDSLVFATEVESDPSTGRPRLKVPIEAFRMTAQAEHLYAQIAAADGTVLWRSATQERAALKLPVADEPGAEHFAVGQDPTIKRFYALSVRFNWVTQKGPVLLDFQVAEGHDLIDGNRFFAGERERFRKSVWPWLLLALLPLLLIPWMLVRWSLSPFRTLTRELQALERGEKHRLSGAHVAEVSALTENLNDLIAANERRVERHRQALSNLAHSLKTPLSIISAELNLANSRSQGQIDSDMLHNAVRQLQDSVSYQLQRAESSGGSVLVRPVQVAQICEKLKRVMLAVYREKDLLINIEVDSALAFRGDEGDLTEFLGNLVDNACKWCSGHVRISAEFISNVMPGCELKIRIEDDGPGIPTEQRAYVLNRGSRLDSTVSGQGIGLALAHELVCNDYHGTLDITTSALGGACINLTLPGLWTTHKDPSP